MAFRVRAIDFDMKVTRGKLCLAIIDDYKKRNGIHRLKKLDEREILKDGNLAIAMEYLGMLHDQEMIKYANTRGGFVDLGQIHMGLRDYMEKIS